MRSLGGSAGLGLRSQGSFGRWGLSRCRAFGNWVLRSNARYGPVPLPPVCGWGTGVFSLGQGNGDLRSEGALLGGLRGAGPALAGIVREVGAFALSRFLRNRVLRSNARCGPVPLTWVCGRGPGVFSLGRG